tara:strand:- start:119 stop:388 length:270 start_codon:yes stop_codon:yes gene_type:complete
MTQFNLNLNAREAQVIYLALSKLTWLGSAKEAEQEVRRQLEKIAVKKLGDSLHDHLVSLDAIEDKGKPDIRTKKEKITDYVEQLESEDE